MAKKRFVVDLGNVELSEKAIQQVESSIQKAALTKPPILDRHDDLVARFPREWLSIWINVGKKITLNNKVFIAFAGVEW